MMTVAGYDVEVQLDGTALRCSCCKGQIQCQCTKHLGDAEEALPLDVGNIAVQAARARGKKKFTDRIRFLTENTVDRDLVCPTSVYASR